MGWARRATTMLELGKQAASDAAWRRTLTAPTQDQADATSPHTARHKTNAVFAARANRNLHRNVSLQLRTAPAFRSARVGCLRRGWLACARAGGLLTRATGSDRHRLLLKRITPVFTTLYPIFDEY